MSVNYWCAFKFNQQNLSIHLAVENTGDFYIIENTYDLNFLTDSNAASPIIGTKKETTRRVGSFLSRIKNIGMKIQQYHNYQLLYYIL